MSFFSKLFNKGDDAVTKEQKEIEKKLKDINRLRYNNKKTLSAVEIENSYFGNGVLVKDSSSDDICYIDVLSGLHFSSFGKKEATSCDLNEFLVKEDNIDHVLASLEKIYEKSDKIMEGCYEEIYNKITKFFEDAGEGSLKDEFDLEYLKENWYLYAIKIYDDYAVFSIGIDAAENSEDDEVYDIQISVDYDTLKADVSFEVVW